jgi:hypothetical protein
MTARMRYRTFDADEVLAYAQAGYSAPRIIETLGLSVGERTIQKFVAANFGRRPTIKSVEAYDPVRSRVVAYMVSQGLSEYYCSNCHRRSSYKGSIRELRRDDSLDSLVFVCRHCSSVADR